MLFQLALFCAIGCMKGHSVGAIECYSCTNSSSLPACTTIVQCPIDSVCTSEYKTVQGTRFYTLGCKNVLSCPTSPTVSPPSIVGRRAAGASTNCSECCHSSHCNRQLCQDTDQYCADDKDYSCANVGSVVDICLEGSHIKPYCKRFCGFCNTVDGGWSHWSEWGNCDVSCGNGTRTKSRTCTDPPPTNGGSDCIGEKQIHESCAKDLCPVHGGWSQWSPWGSCSVTCDVGLQRRDRMCSNPFPARYGDHCYGDSRADRLCFPGACANGSWSSWSAWGQCTKTCDEGVKTRTRNCDNPAPSLTGQGCSGETTEADTCNVSPCQDGSWSSWSAWGQCTKSCDGGVRFRTRDCNNPAPSLTGRYCSGQPTEADACNSSPCQGPVVFFAKVLPGGNGYQSLSVGDTLRFTTVVTNVGHGYDSSTGIFTAPVNGTYSFNVQFCANPGSNAFVGLVVNGVRVSFMYAYDNSFVQCRTLTVPVILKKGDKVQARIESRSSSLPLYQDSNTINTFSGKLD